jgi:hypothetical protein
MERCFGMGFLEKLLDKISILCNTGYKIKTGRNGSFSSLHFPNQKCQEVTMNDNNKKEMHGISVFIVGLLFLILALILLKGPFFLGAVMIPLSFQVIELGWKRIKNLPPSINGATT